MITPASLSLYYTEKVRQIFFACGGLSPAAGFALRAASGYALKPRRIFKSRPQLRPAVKIRPAT